MSLSICTARAGSTSPLKRRRQFDCLTHLLAVEPWAEELRIVEPLRQSWKKRAISDVIRAKGEYDIDPKVVVGRVLQKQADEFQCFVRVRLLEIPEQFLELVHQEKQIGALDGRWPKQRGRSTRGVLLPISRSLARSKFPSRASRPRGYHCTPPLGRGYRLAPRRAACRRSATPNRRVPNRRIRAQESAPHEQGRLAASRRADDRKKAVAVQAMQ